MIASGHTGTANVYFARHTDGDKFAVLIQDIDQEIGYRFPNYTASTSVHIGTSDGPIRYMHCGLCNPVHIDKPRSLIPVKIEPALQTLQFQGLAAKDHETQR